nr:immunoglobulin light chain junction region [Macaca mulatta]
DYYCATAFGSGSTWRYIF